LIEIASSLPPESSNPLPCLSLPASEASILEDGVERDLVDLLAQRHLGHVDPALQAELAVDLDGVALLVLARQRALAARREARLAGADDRRVSPSRPRR
jgi:hypothetical protein